MLKKSIVLRVLPLVLGISVLAGLKRDVFHTIFFPPLTGEHLHNAILAPKGDDKARYTLRDLSYESQKNPFSTDIILSFNKPASALHRDDLKSYIVPYANYILKSGKGIIGGGCAQFFKKRHGVIIQSSRGLWIGRCGDLGSFTIEFRFLPYVLRERSILFSRVGFLSGKKRGIEITLRNGRTRVALYSIFDRPNGKDSNVFLSRGRKLTRGKWYHFVLSYNRITGKLVKYLNGVEEEVTYMTETGLPCEGVYSPSFGYRDREGKLTCLDSSPARIGINYSGLIDEFRISYRDFEDIEKKSEAAYRNYHQKGIIGRIPFNVEGVITSPVYSFAGTGTRVTLFQWKQLLLKETFIWMQFRISDNKFIENDTALKWYRIENPQRNIFLQKIKKGGFLRGKYYQWRAHLIASPDGKSAPALSRIEMHYRSDIPPVRPRFVEASGIGDRSVTLVWRKNVDSDILGYRIYYGTVSRTYDGVISLINGKRITNAMIQGNEIRVKITNKMIEENKKKAVDELLNYPQLRNTVLYFFAVSAYDSYKPNTQYNHESELSTEVSARPFAGSEIR